MRISGISSLTLGASVLIRDSLEHWSREGSHWSALLCFVGLAGLLALAIWSERYNTSGIPIDKPVDPRQDLLAQVSSPLATGQSIQLMRDTVQDGGRRTR